MNSSQAPSLRRRRSRIIRFFARAILSIVFWDLLVRNLGGRGLARRTALARYVNLAARFRELAVELGGVLIKLGQFISSRVDVLPIEITNELAGLQDEVPTTPFEPIRAVIETELARPVHAVFAAFDERAIAAASLGQAYRATLKSGEQVVVKVQRPGIEAIIGVDLDALRWAIGWLKRYRAITRRADLDALFDEFSATLYEEIDYLAEGRNAERFATDFAAWERIRIPAIHWSHTTRRVLTMQDISAIKITEVPAFQTRGVDRGAVAKTLFEFYLQQIFTNGFFHADPHAGNLFVEPHGDGRFTINVVDFGMVGQITPALKAQLREGFIGIALRDVRRLVQAMQAAGWLLPSADLPEIERAANKVFARYWGISMGELRNLDLGEMRGLVGEFRELLYQMPFQIPADILFLGRALGILSGLATSIDPHFNLFAAAEPFAAKMIADEGGSLLKTVWAQATEIGGALVRLPAQADRLLGAALRGELRIRVADTETLIRELHLLNAALRRLIGTLIFGVLLLAGIVLDVSGYRDLSPWAILAAALTLAWFSLLRR
ncbi:MAG TPA: AarF/UbiB family protein [Anaerolineae bacterium]|nr:AarF/UbiB family protein [Anaerolineae bacterium]